MNYLDGKTMGHFGGKEERGKERERQKEIEKRERERKRERKEETLVNILLKA